MRSLTFLLTFSLVVLVSGCTAPGGDGTSFGSGVAITGFESDYPGLTLESGDEVSLLLKVQNKGEVDATNVDAQLFGIDLGEWGTGFSWTGETQDLGTLLAADAQTNTVGQTKTAQWNLETPELPKGTDVTYNPRVRVLYDYQTKAAKSITLVDVDELRKLIQQGRTIQGEPTQTSAGPFRVEIRTGNFIKTQSYDDPFPLNIFITNNLWESGGSVVEGSDFGYGYDQYKYPVKVKLTLPDGMSLSGSGSGCSTSGEWVDLWKGKSSELTCEISITNPPEISVKKLIQVELDYRFSADASTSIRVAGTEEGSLW